MAENVPDLQLVYTYQTRAGRHIFPLAEYCTQTVSRNPPAALLERSPLKGHQRKARLAWNAHFWFPSARDHSLGKEGQPMPLLSDTPAGTA